MMNATAHAVPRSWRHRLYEVADALEDGQDQYPHGKPFRLVRRKDHSGVSGTGIVAKGVVMPDDTVLFWWVVEGKPSSLNIFACVEEILCINGHGGDTWIEWISPAAEHQGGAS